MQTLHRNSWKTSPATKHCSLFNQNKHACITVFAERQDVIYRGCYSDAASGTQEICSDTLQVTCTKCNLVSNCNNTDTTRRGYKCFKCSGLECFKPSHPLIVCQVAWYVGLNTHGENVRGCFTTFSTQTCGPDEDRQSASMHRLSVKMICAIELHIQ